MPMCLATASVTGPLAAYHHDAHCDAATMEHDQASIGTLLLQ